MNINYYSDLSLNDTILLLELIELSTKASDRKGLETLLLTLKKLIPFEKGILSQANLSDPALFSSIPAGWPKEWLERYSSMGYAKIDPVVNIGIKKAGEVLSWNEIFEIQKPDLQFIREAVDFGMLNGIEVTWASQNSVSQFSITGKTEENERTNFILKTVAPHLHTAISRISGIERGHMERKLTKREMETLGYLIKGYSRDETAILLKPPVRRSTIDQSCQNILKKLGARNMVEAAAIATSMMLFEE